VLGEIARVGERPARPAQRRACPVQAGPDACGMRELPFGAASSRQQELAVLEQCHADAAFPPTLITGSSDARISTGGTEPTRRTGQRDITRAVALS